MACDLAAGRSLPCKDGLGGIKEVLWCVLDDVTYGAISAGAVADITSTTTFYRWVLTRNSGSLQQNIVSSIENGTVYYEQVLTIQTPVLDAAVSAELANVNKNRLSISLASSPLNVTKSAIGSPFRILKPLMLCLAYLSTGSFPVICLRISFALSSLGPDSPTEALIINAIKRGFFIGVFFHSSANCGTNASCSTASSLINFHLLFAFNGYTWSFCTDNKDISV